jgi:Ca2+-binding EF-hand superfamily protein
MGASERGLARLRKLVASSWSRVRDVFATWDENGDGRISKPEWIRVLSGLRLSVSRDEASAFFDELDVDGSGSLEYNELHKALRRQDIELEAALRTGAQGEITTASQNVHALRKGGPQTTRSRILTLDAATAPIALADGATIVDQLRNALVGSWARVSDLFQEWDESGDGVVDRREFYRALALLGLVSVSGRGASRADVDALFDTWDKDASGGITFSELRKLLHRGATVEVDAILRAGALGPIQVGATNRYALRKDGPGKKGSNVLSGAQLDGSADDVVAELHSALSANMVRVIDLFREWDDDGDGSIDREEARPPPPTHTTTPARRTPIPDRGTTTRSEPNNVPLPCLRTVCEGDAPPRLPRGAEGLRRALRPNRRRPLRPHRLQGAQEQAARGREGRCCQWSRRWREARLLPRACDGARASTRLGAAARRQALCVARRARHGRRRLRDASGVHARRDRRRTEHPEHDSAQGF